jgi:2-keto-4-pentenoate hydratase/2-oxohepta-3-ene-1,7-dioic acid hydratase in catechol pathway
MRLTTIESNGAEQAAIPAAGGMVPIAAVNARLGTRWAITVWEILQGGQLTALRKWYAEGGRRQVEGLAETIPFEQASFRPLYRQPRKIWGIGLNYREHASDLHEQSPTTAPASFMKPDTAIIGPGDTIEIPLQSHRTTAEAELGVIIGRRCRNVSVREVPEVVAGFTTIIDRTAEDILQQNPRYLTRSKSFDTFFSFGPQLVTTEEVDDLPRLEVATVINGRVHRRNTVANMTFRPWELVAFHSEVMTLLPGDIISTGTPGAVVISDGDVVECRIDGFVPLVNPVRDLKIVYREKLS